MPLISAPALDADYDVCVVGGGPAGLACALKCRDRGMKVLVLEAGGERPTPGRPDLLSADIAWPEHHDPTHVVSAAALGGTTHWWGGRVVPFDPIDFRTWPIRFEEMSSWYEAAADFLGVRATLVSPPPVPFAKLTRFDATRHETLGPHINVAKLWRARITAPDGPAIVLNARVTDLVYESGRVSALRVRIGAEEYLARARRFVLACGGLGGLRLLLLLQRRHPSLMGGPDGMLGRGYMGHLTGSIADLAPAQRSDVEAFCFREIEPNLFARRHIHARGETVSGEGIGHIALWLDNASNEDPAHGSALASAKHLLARAFGQAERSALKPHLANIASAPFAAVQGLARLSWRHAAAQVTGRSPVPQPFLQSRDGAWRMMYHAEQRPDPANRVSLSDKADSIGLPRLRIAFRYADEDVVSVVRAHELLDADLAAAGAGRLLWRGSREECVAAVRAAARDGYHQLGGAPMGNSPRDGVVDSECRVFGVENLWIASSSVFPTGGQANPTLTVVAIACRIAERVATPHAVAA